MDPKLEEQNELAGPTGPAAEEDTSAFILAPEDRPNIDNLVIEDGKPVENIFTEKQQRLLVEPLYSSWPGPGEGGGPFLAVANVGLFFAPAQPPLSPDIMVSLGVRVADDLSRKENRSYLVWVVGQPPDLVIEIVSDRRGGEASHKMRDYARIGVSYYIIYDPSERLGAGVVRAFQRRGGVYEPVGHEWLPEPGLGLTLWQGPFEGYEARWLRWCDRQGQVIPTGQERADQERQRADQERQRAERLAAQLRALGVDPGT